VDGLSQEPDLAGIYRQHGGKRACVLPVRFAAVSEALF
jgi:hypothetical protein